MVFEADLWKIDSLSDAPSFLVRAVGMFLARRNSFPMRAPSRMAKIALQHVYISPGRVRKDDRKCTSAPRIS